MEFAMTSFLELINQSLPLLMQGAMLTLKLWLCTALLSISLGTLFGVLTCKNVRVPVVSRAIAVCTFFMRAIPFYVQLLLVYFVLPELVGINLSAFAAGVIALGLCSSGYVCQIVQAGINSISQGQWDACKVLGMGTLASLRYVMMPQMLNAMLPTLINELESMLKSTSIISSIGVLELTRMGMNIVSRQMNPIEVYVAVALFYVAFSSILMLLAKYVEKKLAYPKG